MRKLICDDNLAALRNDVQPQSVDLIYLDPPFNSQTNYNVFFKNQTGNSAGAQILAFEDTWLWGDESEEALNALVSRHGEVAEFLNHTVKRLGHNSLSAYLVMMAARLVEMHRVLKPTGSLYLHCDPTASHYLKVVLDTIFGVKNYRAEITWKRSSAHNDAKQGRKAFGNITDIIFYYTKSDDYTFHV